MLWLAVANSFCLDFVVRQKVALTMAFNIVDTLPLPRQFLGSSIEHELARRALQLSCAGPEMDEFWREVSPVFGLQDQDKIGDDPQRRLKLRTEVDVLVARDFFGLTKDEMRYLLDPSEILGNECGIETFGALKRSEIRRDGNFTSMNDILSAWADVGTPH
jgi:hypothetical protein